MYYAYVLQSLQGEHYYKGHCENLEKRLAEHNSGKTASIKMFAPFEVIYFEVFETRAEAVNREKYFKTSAGRKYLKTILIKKAP